MPIPIPGNAKGFTLGGTHSSDFNVILDTNSIPILPVIQNRRLHVPGMAGSIIIDSHFGDNVMPLMINILHRKEEDRWEEAEKIADWLNPIRGLQPLVLDIAPHKEYNVIVDGQLSMQQLVVGKALLIFAVPDVHPRSVTEKTVTGTTPMDMYFANGSVTSPCKIKVTLTSPPGGDNISVSNLQSGEFIKLQKNPIKFPVDFEVGDVIEIDTGTDALGTRRVLYNGENAEPGVTIDSKYFHIAPKVVNQLDVNSYTNRLYWEGTGYVDFDAALTAAAGPYSYAYEEGSHVELFSSSGGGGSAIMSIMRDELIDLSFVNEISVNWNRFSASGEGIAYIAARLPSGIIARKMDCTRTSAGADTMDVSDLSGNYYITLQAWTSVAGELGLKVYRVYLDRYQVQVPISSNIEIQYRERWVS